MSKRPATVTKKTVKPQPDAAGYIKSIAFWGICLLLFLAPFFRGLFFPEEQQKALFFALFIFGLVLLDKWLSKKYSLMSHPLDYLMLALPLVYTLSVFNAVNYGLAVDGVVKVILYFIVYWCVAQLAFDHKRAIALITVIYMGGLGLAAGGLMTATKIINIKDGIYQNQAIASFFQYTNSLSAYLGAILILGTYFWWKHTFRIGNEEKTGDRLATGNLISFLFAAGNYLIALVFIGADSKGGLLIFGFAVFMLLLLLPGWNRVYALINIVSTTFPAVLGYHFFIKNSMVNNNVQAWLWIIPGLLMVILFQWVYFQITPILHRYLKQVSIFGFVMLVFMSAGVIFLGADKIINLGQKVALSGLLHRFYYMGDAIQMVKLHPLTGWGGGGWQEVYRFFQSFYYLSSQVHSHFVQVAVETGITGLLIFSSFWVFLLFSAKRAIIKSTDIQNKVYIVFLVVSSLSLIMHSLLDFGLSLSAISLTLYTLSAFIRNSDKGDGARRTDFSKIPFVAAAFSGFVLMVLVGCLITGNSYAKKSAHLISQGDPQAIMAMEKASYLNPLRFEYQDSLVQLYIASGQKKKAMEMNLSILEKYKYSTLSRVRMANIYFESGDYANAAKYAGEVIKLAPWQIESYEYASYMYKNLGLSELRRGKTELAKQYFKETTEIPKIISEMSNKVDSPVKKTYNETFGFKANTRILLSEGAAHLFLGNLEEARKNLYLAGNENNDENIRGEAFALMSILYERLGDSKQSVYCLEVARALSPKFEKTHKEYRDLFIIIRSDYSAIL